MIMKCVECGGTDLVVCATLYLNIGTGADGTHTVGAENVPRDEIDLACRVCGSPVAGDEQSTYAETARRLIAGLLRDGQARPAPGADAGPCAGCGKPLTWDRSGSRVHDEWGEYLCPATHTVHRTREATA
ncbi:hypothetical protein [Streptomyces acidiscabies]|uniref:hypothetical protein n=1 Tax=Streptomyces acidiscabies TaxID=42234 RepID=UPI0009526285|nr:hypothetical protein [Streptomyces acidiscabies]